MDSLDEIRRWHKLNRDTTNLHWQRVDELLTEIAAKNAEPERIDPDSADGLRMYLDDALRSIEDAIHALRRQREKTKKAA